MKNQFLSKEFLKMQKLAGVITEGQYKEKINENILKQGDKVNGGFVLASSDDNDILDTDFTELLALSKDGATKEDFVIIGPNRTTDVSYAGQQLIDLINNSNGKIQIKKLSTINQPSTTINEYRDGDNIFDVIYNELIQPDQEKYYDETGKEDDPNYGVGFDTSRNSTIGYQPEDEKNYLKYLKKRAGEGNEKAIELLNTPEIQFLLKQIRF